MKIVDYSSRVKALSTRLLAMAGGLAVLLLIGTNPAQATLPSEKAKENGKIVYAAWDDQDYEIFSVKPDGTGLAQLTNNTSDDYEPATRPMGRRSRS